MGKRVAKEIDEVVNKFYPSLENHFIQFKDLDNSYQELVLKFEILEKALDYATQLDSKNIKIYETGFVLCNRVIETPRKYAIADQYSAIGKGIVGALQDNKYKRQDAMSDNLKASRRKNEVKTAAKSIFIIQDKYINAIKSLNPAAELSSTRELYKQEFERDAVLEKNSTDQKDMWKALFSFRIVEAIKLAWSPFFRNTGLKK